ncbi:MULTISPECIES: hypothetical protein [unclassified Agrococcus]|uniref:hypothetical protein n=1 Tax=unclassified Agrococcus TaxID=2615065 RepID=UPI003611CB9D
MSDGMPDFAMPSDDELAAERRAAEDAARAAASATPSAAREDADETGGVGARAPAAGGDASLPAATARRSPRSRRAAARARASALVRTPTVAFAAGGVLAAALALVPAAVAESAAERSSVEAHEVLAAYVEAVRSGDVEAARAAWMPTGSQASLELLEAGATPDEPPVVECDDPLVGERRATASCEIAVMSVEHASSGSSTIVLERADDGWRVVAGLAEMAVVTMPGAVVREIGGAAADDVDAQQWLMPGGYDVDWAPSTLFEGGDLGGLVVTRGGGWLQVDAQLAPEARAEAEATALAFVEACLVDAATAASCTLEQPEGRGAVTATAEAGYGWSDRGYVVPVRIEGLGDADAPIVEVEVLLADDGATWEMVVRSVLRWGEP